MSSIDVAKVVASEATVSDKIRVLAGAGYERAEIARLLGKRYQHVRNVLEADRVAARRPVPRSGPAQREAHFSAPRKVNPNRAMRFVVGPGGELALPPELLQAMGLNAGDALIGKLDGDDLVLTSGPVALKRVQALVRSIVPPGVSLVDDLLADRRREAEAEAGG